MAEDIDIKVKQNKAGIAAVQQATARIENDIVVDDGLNVAGKAFLDSGVIESSSDTTPSPWQIRANYTSSTSETGVTIYTGFYEVYSPYAYYNGKVLGFLNDNVDIWDVSRNTWYALDDLILVATAGVLYARLKINTETNECEGVVLEFGKKSDTPDGFRYIDYEICEFYDSGFETFGQIHMGPINHVEAGGQGLVLGPMEYTSTPTARFVQYMGRWSFSESNSGGDGEWIFTRATNADGTERPPAKIYLASIAQMLVKGSSGYPGADVISVVDVPVLHAGTPGIWLQRQSVRVAGSVDYSAPNSELDAGYLTKRSTTITYFESLAASTGSPEVILSTITEDANEATTYESSDSGSSSGGSEE